VFGFPGDRWNGVILGVLMSGGWLYPLGVGALLAGPALMKSVRPLPLTVHVAPASPVSLTRTQPGGRVEHR